METKSATQFETVISGYKVDLDIDMDGNAHENEDLRVTGCWINYKSYSASLEVLNSFGHLDQNDGGEPHVVPKSVIKAINKWANDLGYGGEDEDA